VLFLACVCKKIWYTARVLVRLLPRNLWWPMQLRVDANVLMRRCCVAAARTPAPAANAVCPKRAQPAAHNPRFVSPSPPLTHRPQICGNRASILLNSSTSSRAIAGGENRSTIRARAAAPLAAASSLFEYTRLSNCLSCGTLG